MAVADITKPIALDETLQGTNSALGALNATNDEIAKDATLQSANAALGVLNTTNGGIARDATLQSTNTALGLLGKDTSLQAIAAAIAGIGLNTVGNLSSLTTAQKTSLVAAINELVSDKVSTSEVGTAAAKDFITSVIDGSNDLVTSDAVHDAIANAVSSLLTPSGSKTCTELVSSLLVEANLGNAYNMSDSGTTTADFVEGAGKPINVGDTVAIVLDNGAYKFDLLSGFVDLSNYIQKSSTNGLIKNDGSIDSTAYVKQSEMAVTNGTGADADKTTIQLKNGTSATVLKEHQDISGKVDKVQGKGLSTNDYTTNEKNKLSGIAAGATKTEKSNTNGNIKINGTETRVYNDEAIQTALAGKAEKSEMTITDGTGADADKTTIQLKDGLSKTVLKEHQDISGKQDKLPFQFVINSQDNGIDIVYETN